MSVAIEKLRRIWTPGREIEEIVHQLEPQAELDSMLRDFLHRTLQQRGPVTLDLTNHRGEEILNTGTLRWEIVHHEPAPGRMGKREVSLWIEEEA